MHAVIRGVIEPAVGAAERTLCCCDVLIAVFDGPLGLTRCTAPLQLHAIAMNDVLEVDAAQRVTLLAYFGDAKRNGCVRRRHGPRAYHLRAFENVDRDQKRTPTVRIRVHATEQRDDRVVPRSRASSEDVHEAEVSSSTSAR